MKKPLSLTWVSDVSVAVEWKVEGDAVEGGQVDGLLGAAARGLELCRGINLAARCHCGVAEELVHAREEVGVEEAVLRRRRRRLLLMRRVKPGQSLNGDNQFEI